MLMYNVALVSETDAVSPSELSQIVAALQKQVTRDFAPIWQINATINSFTSINEIPIGYWPIIIKDDINTPGLGGTHLDSNGQPYALIQAGSQNAFRCSHEFLEMLADPFGNRLVPSDSIKSDQGRVNYLVEVCDPMSNEKFGYTINNILVCDFYTPNYFDPVTSTSIRYSFNGSVKSPKQILNGGYLSWQEPETREWWQAIVAGGQMTFRTLGQLNRTALQSWREIIDFSTTSVTEDFVVKRKVKKLSQNSHDLRSRRVIKTREANSEYLLKDINYLMENLKKN